MDYLKKFKQYITEEDIEEANVTGNIDALRNSGRFLQEAGVQSVKLEGGVEVSDTVRHIVNAGVPVMGHIGLTPQSLNKFGTYKVQGRSPKSA